MQHVYATFGVNLPRYTYDQHATAVSITKEELKPGVLVFYSNDYDRVCHVAIYIGNDQVIHASNDRDGVIISPIDYRPVHSYGAIQ